jgi:ribonuclease HI
LKKIIIYTDGSCLGNPGPGGWAFLLARAENGVSKKVFFKASGGEIQTTNNRMEMTAFLEALKYLAKNFSSHQLEINSDSNLIVQTINQGWKKKANQDLWSEIDSLLPKLNLEIFWVKAHATDKLNNQCDKLAFAAAQKAQKLAAKLPRSTSAITKPAKKKSQQESLF